MYNIAAIYWVSTWLPACVKVRNANEWNCTCIAIPIPFQIAIYSLPYRHKHHSQNQFLAWMPEDSACMHKLIVSCGHEICKYNIINHVTEFPLSPFQVQFAWEIVPIISIIMMHVMILCCAIKEYNRCLIVTISSLLIQHYFLCSAAMDQ